MKIRQIKRMLAVRLLARRPLLRPTRVQIKAECSITGVIDAIARVNTSMRRFSAAAAEAAIISQQFAQALSPHQHAIDDWRLHPRNHG